MVNATTMRTVTRSLYALAGLGAAGAGAIGVVAPGPLLPADALTPLAAHLAREEAAAFVFIGAMLLWSARHVERARPVHLAMVLFTALFAAIHWAGYFGQPSNLAAAAVNTVPFVLFAVTVPARR